MVDELTGGGHGGPEDPPGTVRTNRIVTVPNIICGIRLAGSPVLAGLAVAGRHELFLWLFVALALSDWVDGKLAILLDQRSVLGARLDSWADASLYVALLFGSLWMHGDTLRSELPWIVAAVGSYAAATLAGLGKFRRWPSYHTRLAKTSWFLILVGAVCLLGEWSLWPLRVALAVVTLTNLEAILITALTSRWRADVGSVLQVMRDRKESP